MSIPRLERSQWLVLALWLAIVAFAVPFAARRSEHLSLGGYAVPGSQSARVDSILANEYPKVSRLSLAVLLWPDKGATEVGVNRAIHRLVGVLAASPGVRLPRQAREQAEFSAGLVGPIVMPLQVDVGENKLRALVERLRSRLSEGGEAGGSVETHLLGESAIAASLESASQSGLSRAEKIGFPILLIVLVTIFGSISAAMLPLILAAVAVIVTGALIYLLSLATQLSVFTVDTASMFGIGVAVDYSLIVVSRVRQELRAGHDLAQARAIGLATSGRAVIFSGLVVMASLATTWLIPINTLQSMAAGAIVVVAVSVLATTTLLPVLIDLLGARWAKTGMRLKPWRSDSGATPRWDRWARIVTGHPILAIGFVACLLVPLSAPMLGMRTSMGTREQLSARNETRVGLGEVARVEGPDALGPIYLTLHSTGDASRAELRALASKLRLDAKRLGGVRSAGRIEMSREGEYALFTVRLDQDPETPAAQSVVERLRADASSMLGGREIDIAVGGISASLLDDKRKIVNGLWKMIVAVLVASFAVLIVVFRSLLLPLKAIAMNLISVSVSYGVLVIVFQWGWFDSLFDYRSPGQVYTLVLPLILAIVFGLSMDYEVFLLMRIKEQWLISHDSRKAVTEGLAASGTAISGAAFILVCVFAIFVGTGVQTIKELGLGAAVAIGVDATLIRLVLVPATMQLLGKWNWWLPSSVARLLPVQAEVSVAGVANMASSEYKRGWA